jgi:hypothetical protein
MQSPRRVTPALRETPPAAVAIKRTEAPGRRQPNVRADRHEVGAAFMPAWRVRPRLVAVPVDIGPAKRMANEPEPVRRASEDQSRAADDHVPEDVRRIAAACLRDEDPAFAFPF